MAATYDIGDTVRCTATFTTASTAVDPTTVIARVNTPLGVTTSYVYGTDAALLKDGIGVYHIDIYPANAGKYTYRFEGGGVAGSAVEATFNVRVSAFYS